MSTPPRAGHALGVPIGIGRGVVRFAIACRQLAARLPTLSSDGRYDAVLALLRQAPGDSTREERALVVALMAELANRAVGETGRTVGLKVVQPLPLGAVVSSIRAGHHPHVDRALAVMAEGAGDSDLCLDRVSASVGLSRWQVSRLLRAWTGRSFFGLLSTLRVQEAKRLLVETELSIKEVATLSGYDHVSQLDHQFRRHAGLTPGVYRSLWKVG